MGLFKMVVISYLLVFFPGSQMVGTHTFGGVSEKNYINSTRDVFEGFKLKESQFMSQSYCTISWEVIITLPKTSNEFAPEKCWVGYDPASFLGNLGLFAGRFRRISY